MSKEIPESVIQQIDNTMFMTGGNTDAEKDFYKMGAIFGYSLAASGSMGAGESQSVDEESKAASRIEMLKHMMGLVRYGWSEAALRLSEYCTNAKVSPDFQDFIIDLLNSDKKRAFVLELFEKELAEVQLPTPGIADV